MGRLGHRRAPARRADLVFTGAHGAPLRHGSYYQRHFKPAAEKIGVPNLRFHDLRHTAVALLIDLGEHPKVIANRMGHSSISITMDRYGHLHKDHDDNLKGKLETLYASAEPQPDNVTELRP